MMQEAATQSFIGLYTPYLVIFTLFSLLTLRLVSHTEYIKNIDIASDIVVAAAVSVIAGLMAAVVLRPVLFSTVGI